MNHTRCFGIFLLITLVFASVDAQSASIELKNRSNEFVYFESTLEVPEVPKKAWQTLYLWPGLQSSGYASKYYPIGNGVLQPVLTWGTPIAPKENPTIMKNASWWISGQYVNTDKTNGTLNGWWGGNQMAVAPKAKLRLIIELSTNPGYRIPPKWKQTIIDTSNNNSVSFEIDLHGQEQTRAYLMVEPASGQWPSDTGVPEVKFTNIILRTKHNFACKNWTLDWNHSLSGQNAECNNNNVWQSAPYECTYKKGCKFNMHK